MWNWLFLSKKNPKRYRPSHDWWIENGWNVKGREGYKNIITEISVNSFDDISTFIFETFIKKYQPTIDKYSELVEYIDNTFKDSYNKIYNEYLSTNKFDNAILEYKNKIIV